MNWFSYALMSAVCAALVAIFGKLGLTKMDSTQATALRAVVMAVITLLAAVLLGKFRGFTWQSVSDKEWLWIILAGAAGALSWIFYFYALKIGPVPAVAAIDRLSLLFVFFLAVLFLKEPFTWKSAFGAILVAVGAIMMSLSWQQLRHLMSGFMAWFR